MQTRGDQPFLGKRRQVGTDDKGAPILGDYVWESYREVERDVENLTNGILSLNLAPEVDAENRKWRFIGIWSPNRAEWPKTMLACMNYKMTTVGFYDAMGLPQVDYIINQTEMSTIFCTS